MEPLEKSPLYHNVPEEIRRALDPQVLEVIKTLDSGTQARFLKTITGINKRGGETYYNKNSAIAVKVVADEMLLDRCDREIREEDFAGRWKVETLRQKFYSGINYLLDHLDTPDKKYDKWYREIKIKKDDKKGILYIRFTKPEDDQFLQFRAHKIVPTSEAFTGLTPAQINQKVKINNGEWKSKLTELMSELPADKSFTIADIVLSDDDIEYVRNLFYDLPDFTVHINMHRIKVTNKIFKDDEGNRVVPQFNID